MKIVKNLENGRLNNLNDRVLNVLISLTATNIQSSSVNELNFPLNNTSYSFPA